MTHKNTPYLNSTKSFQPQFILRHERKKIQKQRSFYLGLFAPLFIICCFVFLLGGDFLGIKQAIFGFGYDLFVRWPLRIVEGIAGVFIWLASGSIIDSIFGLQGHSYSYSVADFDKWLIVGVSLGVLLFAVFILHTAFKGETKRELAGSVQRFVLAILIIVLLPIVFFVANFIVSQLITLIFGGTEITGHELANSIAKTGWDQGHVPSGWNYNDIPSYDGGYNLLVGCFGTWFSLFIFFIISLSLIKRLFDIFILYAISPLVFMTAVGSDRWKRVAIWKDLTIIAFLSSFAAMLSLYTFTILTERLNQIVDQQHFGSLIYTAAKLIIVCGAAIGCYEGQRFFTSIIGGNTSISEGLSALRMFQVAGGATASAVGATGRLAGIFRRKGGSGRYGSTRPIPTGGLSGEQNNFSSNNPFKNFAKYEANNMRNPVRGFAHRGGIGLATGIVGGGIYAGSKKINEMIHRGKMKKSNWKSEYKKHKATFEKQGFSTSKLNKDFRSWKKAHLQDNVGQTHRERKQFNVSEGLKSQKQAKKARIKKRRDKNQPRVDKMKQVLDQQQKEKK